MKNKITRLKLDDNQNYYVSGYPENGIEYLEYQREEYKKRSLKSLQALNDFAIQNGLVGNLDGIVDNNINKKKDKTSENNSEK